jgi:DNA-binding transcriptional LysR family regulator
MIEFEFRQLRHFIAVADELHFGRAAARTRIVQPALTQSIQKLEACLGVRLLDRHSRKVALTAAGAVFLREAKALTAQATLARNLALRAAKQSTSTVVRLGFVASSQHWLIPEAVLRFSAERPGVKLDLHDGTPASITAQLLEGALDVGVFYLPYGDLSARSIAARTLTRPRPFIAVPRNSALARKAKLTLADLADQPFVLFPADADPHLHRSFMSACAAAGFTPKIVHETPLVHTLLHLVAKGIGVTPVNELTRHTPVGEVAFVPLVGAPSSLNRELVVGWLPQCESPDLRSLASIIQAIASGSARSAGADSRKRRAAEPARIHRRK